MSLAKKETMPGMIMSEREIQLAVKFGANETELRKDNAALLTPEFMAEIAKFTAEWSKKTARLFKGKFDDHK